jgi:hypothetical protein
MAVFRPDFIIGLLRNLRALGAGTSMPASIVKDSGEVERETGLEPATFSLEG